VAELGRLPYRPLREPAVALLAGEAVIGTHWHFASAEADPVLSIAPLA
jgi:hypothetical protein